MKIPLALGGALTVVTLHQDVDRAHWILLAGRVDGDTRSCASQIDVSLRL
jgi:hypothetical protein